MLGPPWPQLDCSIATLPLGLYDTEWRPLPSEFFRSQPDVPNVTHLAQTIEDLVCDAIARWQVTERDSGHRGLSRPRDAG